jgi:hypothetical protein
MPLKQIKNSWNAGELSQYMDGRTDLSKYYNGASNRLSFQWTMPLYWNGLIFY